MEPPLRKILYFRRPLEVGPSREGFFFFLSFSSILYFVRKVHGKYLLGRRGRRARVGIREKWGFFTNFPPFSSFVLSPFFLLAWLNLLFPLPVSLFFLSSILTLYLRRRRRKKGHSETNRGRWAKKGVFKRGGGGCAQVEKGGDKTEVYFLPIGCFLGRQCAPIWTTCWLLLN